MSSSLEVSETQEKIGTVVQLQPKCTKSQYSLISVVTKKISHRSVVWG